MTMNKKPITRYQFETNRQFDYLSLGHLFQHSLSLTKVCFLWGQLRLNYSLVIFIHAILFGTQSYITLLCVKQWNQLFFFFPLQTKRKLSAKWKVAKVHNYRRLVFSSPASSHCATDMVATAKFSVDHLGNVGVWIAMATSYQGQRQKGYLTVIQMVRVCFC